MHHWPPDLQVRPLQLRFQVQSVYKLFPWPLTFDLQHDQPISWSHSSVQRRLFPPQKRGQIYLNHKTPQLNKSVPFPFFLLCELQRRGIGVFEQYGARRRSTDFQLGQSLGSEDHLVALKKPRQRPSWMSQTYYDDVPETLTVRELKTGGKILVTTLSCPQQVPKAALKSLYKDRWHVELDLRNLKTTLGLETLSCKTPGMAVKELWVYLLAHNLIRMVMAQSALLADCLPRQLSFKHSLQLCLALRQYRTGEQDDEVLKLLQLIARKRVGNRPSRIEPRAVKRRPKPYPKLMQARGAARAEVRKNGYPKKVK